MIQDQCVTGLFQSTSFLNKGRNLSPFPQTTARHGFNPLPS
ncbi:hypothetical protein LEP1GSC166_1775 [Leptospira kirschneri]|nr:hypothetical protein LEP1GSC166_1775 [Leptospira kirschneri]